MAKFPMDLSKFGKISSNDKKSTLKHKDGHFMVIAHAPLDQETRKALDALPFANGGKVKKNSYKEQPASKDPGKARSGVRPQDLFPEKYPERDSNPKLQESKKTPMADGGEIAEPDPKKAAEFQKGATESGWQPEKWAKNIKEGLGLAEGGEVPEKQLEFAETESEPSVEGKEAMPLEIERIADAAAAEAAGPPAPSPEQMAASQDMSSAPASQPQVEAVPDEAMTAAPSNAPPQAAAPPTPAPEPSLSQHILGERNNFAQDLMTGQVHPKTYSDLFAEKGTPGKIGTIFGLMLSGIGSGLSHQPNALMAMMDKQIERDLDAQKHSAANRQNFYKIAQQQVINDATVKKLAADTGMTRAQAADAWNKAGLSGIDLNQARESLGISPKLTPAQELEAHTRAKHAMEISAMHDLDQKNQKLPPGSAIRQAADATLGTYAQKKLMQDHPIEAEHAENAANSEEQQTAAAMQQRKESNHLLSPDAEDRFTKAQYSALIRKNPSLAGELEEQYQAASQADKATDAVVDSFENLKKMASPLSRAYSSVSPGSLGTLGAGMGAGIAGTKGAEVGGGLGAALGHLMPTTSGIRQYEAEKAKLEGVIGNALAAAKLTPTEVGKMIDKYAPIYGDSPAALETKLSAILDKIKLGVKTTRLHQAKMTRD